MPERSIRSADANYDGKIADADKSGSVDFAAYLTELYGYGENGFDLICDLPERTSFRQNQFLIYLRAQSLSRNGCALFF